MQAEEVLARARSMLGRRTIYVLGHGGVNPTSPKASDPNGMCDCSGFVAWCMGVGRHTTNPWYVHQNGGWFETSAIYRDALAQGVGMFDAVAWPSARPGMLLVWPDGGGHQGHVGIVTEVDASGPTKVIHCSRGNYDGAKDAVQETGVIVFQHHNAIVARCAWVVHGAAA